MFEKMFIEYSAMTVDEIIKLSKFYRFIMKTEQIAQKYGVPMPETCKAIAEKGITFEDGTFFYWFFPKDTVRTPLLVMSIEKILSASLKDGRRAKLVFYANDRSVHASGEVGQFVPAPLFHEFIAVKEANIFISAYKPHKEEPHLEIEADGGASIMERLAAYYYAAQA